MNNLPSTSIEVIIQQYIEHKEKSIFFGKKKLDAEKEYNKNLTKYNGEVKNYSLEQANRIYKSYLDMQAYGEESGKAEQNFLIAEEQLRAIGEILFEATISAEIPLISQPGNEAPSVRPVTVAYSNGHVIVS